MAAVDFPTLVSPAAWARHRARLRGASRGRSGAPDLLRAARSAVGRRVRRDRAAAALARHAPAPLPGEANLYLPAGATALYSDDPAGDWARLAEGARVKVLPGANEDLLREPVVAELASRIHAAMDAAGWPLPAATRPAR